MRIKTIIIVVVAILLTIVFMQNRDAVKFTLLFGTSYISKITIMLAMAVIGFILGFMLGRPGSSKYKHTSYDDDKPANTIDELKPNTLSDDDRDYLN